jgi:hypothetical protein
MMGSQHAQKSNMIALMQQFVDYGVSAPAFVDMYQEMWAQFSGII